MCLHTEFGNLSVQVLRKLMFLESLLFHYIMIDIGYNEKNRISSYYNGLISILLDTELAVCFGRGQCTKPSYLNHI